MAGCCYSSELIPLTRSIVKCKVIRDELMQFLLTEHNEENLEFLIEVQVYKTRLLPCTRAYHGRKIVDKFIKTGSEKELNISSVARKEFKFDYTSQNCFDSVCRHVEVNLRDPIIRWQRTKMK